MNHPPNDSAAVALLKRFFRPPHNAISLHALGPDAVGAYADVRAWAERIARAPRPTVLPRIDAAGGVWWYGLARSEQELAALVADLRAFLGPTYADLTGVRVVLDPGDPLEAAVAAYTGGRALRFQADLDRVRPALRRMFAVRDARPGRARSDGRAPGLLLRQFHAARAAGEEALARETLAVLRERGWLDATNARNLELALLAALGRWADLLAHPDLSDVLAQRPPAAVADDVLRAAFHVRVAPATAAEDAEAATAAAAGVYAAYPALFERHTGLTSVEAWQVVGLAAPDDATSSAALDALDAADAATPVRAWLRARLAPPPSPPADPLAAAGGALARGEVDEAFRLAAGVPDGPERARLLLTTARVLGTLEAARVALEAVAALDEATRDAVLTPTVFRAAYEALGGATGPPPPDGWAAWLQRLHEDPDLPLGVALAYARAGEQEWGAATLLTPDGVAAAVRLLAVPDAHAATLSAGLPHLLSALQGAPAYPDPSLAPVYRALLEHVALVEAPTTADAALAADLLPAVLDSRIDTAAYRETVAHTLDLMELLRAAPPVDRLLDALDALVAYPCPDTDARVGAFARAAALAERYAARWAPGDVRFLRQLADEAGCAEAVAGVPKSDPTVEQEVDSLAGLGRALVGVYTLTERAGQRFALALRDAAPGVRVELSTAHVGSYALRHLARNADYFVVATASGKHAATGFIEMHHGRRPLVRPAGKGTASMLRALREHLTGG